MIHTINIAVSRVIDECNIQTSLDLQAMRARGVEAANVVYDDWVLTEDNSTEVYYSMQEFCADMVFALRTLIASHSAGKDIISVDIRNYQGEDLNANTIETLIRQYLKYRNLSWWYQYRDADLSVGYGNKANAALNNIFTQCMPRSGTACGRYF